MYNKKITVKEVKKDFEGIIGSRSRELKFLKKYSKSKIYVSKTTGTVYHSPTVSSLQGVSNWSKKIYSKKIDSTKIKYTSVNPIMKSRHYYSALFINQLLKKKEINFCDYATGEGNFGSELIKINKNIIFNFTEHSSYNFKKTLGLIKKTSKKNFNAHNGSIESSITNKNFKNFDAASLLWTLCNCIKPIEILETIHRSLKQNGLLLISESSRILVPFKKPIHNFFVKNYETKNTHPWYFSINSLSNLLEISGFRIIKMNRYYDENDLVIIAQKKDKKKHKPILKKDNYVKVTKFFKEWEKNAQFFKNYNYF